MRTAARIRRISYGVALATLLVLCGCGYIGEPLPPLLNIPGAVRDLTAAQRGSKIILQFSLPQLTTEGMPFRTLERVEVRAGVAVPGVFKVDTWVANSKPLTGISTEQERVRYEMPASPWIGNDIIVGARVFGVNGRASEWSNFVTLSVVTPLNRPSHVRAEVRPNGVLLTWVGSAKTFRVFRREGDERALSVIGDSVRAEWVDNTAQFGKTYRYAIEAINKAGASETASERSEEVSITPEDRFPPAVPSGLTAVVSTQSIELTWDRNTESDLAGYRVYRLISGDEEQKVAELQDVPSYSDRNMEAGRHYRYAVTAVDKLGNESQKSAPVEINAP